MTSTIHKFSNQPDFINQSTRLIESLIVKAIQKNGEARIVLSGGNSPKEIYQHLGRSQVIDWSRVSIFMADERYAPANSHESNAKMIREHLIKNIPEVHFYPFQTELRIEQAAEEYDNNLCSLQKKPLFDLVILGLGSDGHTASLFPHLPELDEAEKWVVPTLAKGHPTEKRLSLTFPALMNGGNIVFLIQGNKDAVIQKWLYQEGDFHELPARKILSHPSVSIYYFNPNT